MIALESASKYTRTWSHIMDDVANFVQRV